MLSEKLLRELNEQIKYEFFSANYYLAMAAFCASRDFNGFANFFIVQAEEERFHAMKFFNFINERGERVFISALDEPKNDFQSLEEVFTLALHHEKFVTARIYSLMDLAGEEREHATISFLKWFIDEQVEEEAGMSDILSKIQRIGENGEGIYHLDKELSLRTFTPPAE
ncbi:ferritin [Candidatus Micrarchaeota archaeon]|nr:ferritin [Candidatus Micrarchaeota archaeon]